MKYVIRLKDIPAFDTVESYIARCVNLGAYAKMPFNSKLNPVLKFQIDNFDAALALQSVQEAVDTHGWWGYVSHFNDTPADFSRDTYYGGFSITYNPSMKHIPIHASALGDRKINLHDFFQTDFGRKILIKLSEHDINGAFYGAAFVGGLPLAKKVLEKYDLLDDEGRTYDWDKPFTPTSHQLKDTYFDSYGFRRLTPAALHGYHGEFLKHRVTRSLCRSRVAYINANNHVAKSPDYMWHRDENIFICMRVNIPLISTENYKFEIKDEHVGELTPGFGYTWDTQKLHRVYSVAKEDSKRINMVLGVCPWFDYIEEDDVYVSNEFFGELHPFDMLANGHVISDIQTISQ